MAASALVGAWKLLELKHLFADGEIKHQFGPNPMGQLMYDAGGHVSVHIMRPDRQPFASGDRDRGTPEEVQNAFDGYVAYFGTYEFDAEAQTIVHHLEGNIFPNSVGTLFKRRVQVNGNRLLLDTEPLTLGGRELVISLVWERLQSQGLPVEH